MTKKNPLEGFRSALVLMLCAIFFVLAMGLTLLGSNVYRGTVAHANARYTERTALSYLVNQLRRGDMQDGITIGTFGDGDALQIAEQIEGSTYITRLYCLDGQLCELFADAEVTLTPQDGIPVLPLPGLKIQAQGDAIALTVTDEEGNTYTAAISPRCGYEEVPAL